MTAVLSSSTLAARPSAARPRRLAGCCLLDGGVRSAPLAEEAGRSVLDLDVSPGRRLLDHWLARLAPLAWGVQAPPLRILHGGRTAAPEPRDPRGLSLQIVADSDSFRGPAGVIRDAMIDLAPDQELLVCEAGRYLGVGLDALIDHHQRERADVTIAREPDGSPTGVLLVSRATLDLIAPRGFVDLKEQWLGRVVASGATVLVHDMPAPSPAVRTRLDLLRIARAESGQGTHGDHEAWHPGARLARRLSPGWSIAPTARISPSAVVARSIVMEGAIVGDDAVVSSSIVLPGLFVPPGSLVIDRVVG